VSERSVARERADVTGTAGAADAAPVTTERSWAGVGDVVVILGCCLIAWILTNDFAQADLMISYGIRPEVVPRAIILIIAGMALLLLGSEFGQRHGRLRVSLHPRIPAVLAVLAALVVYTLSFEPWGAFALMPVFCVVVSRAFVRRPLWRLCVYGVAVTVATWVLFVLLLRAPLPGSSLPFL
jgi:Tripartite tricarboxylate transporter TctB family